MSHKYQPEKVQKNKRILLRYTDLRDKLATVSTLEENEIETSEE